MRDPLCTVVRSFRRASGKKRTQIYRHGEILMTIVPMMIYMLEDASRWYTHEGKRMRDDLLASVAGRTEVI